MPKPRKTLPSSDRSATGRSAGARDDAHRDAAIAPSQADHGDPRRRKSPPKARDESPLKSLGKAVSAPVLGAAEEDEGEKPA